MHKLQGKGIFGTIILMILTGESDSMKISSSMSVKKTGGP